MSHIFTVEIGGVVARAYGCTLEKRQDEIDRFIIQIPRRIVAQNDFFLADVKVYKNGQVILSGFVEDDQAVSIASDGAVISDVVCFADIGRLTLAPGRTLLSNFVHHIAAGIVENVLSVAGNYSNVGDWEIGDLTSMSDHIIRTTVQLQFKDTLWSQIKTMIGGLPQMHVRYGGVSPVTGKHLLDLGTFTNTTPIRLSNHNLIDQPELQGRTERPVKSIKPFGGDDGDGNRLNVLDALLIEPTLSDPGQDYQIVTDSDGYGYVVNNLVSKGINIVKNYDAQKVDSNAPTADMKRKAALALYYAVVRDLEARALQKTVSVRALLPEIPRVREQFFLSSRVVERHYDPIRQALEETASFEFNEQMTAVSIDCDLTLSGKDIDPLDLEHQDFFVVTLELSSTGYPQVTIPNEVVLLAVKAQNYERNGEETHVNIAEDDVQVSHTSIASDCPNDEFAGKQFIFYHDLHTRGLTYQGMGFSYEVSVGDGIRVYVKQYPQIDGTPLILCVSGENGSDWDVYDNVTIDAFFVGVN